MKNNIEHYRFRIFRHYLELCSEINLGKEYKDGVFRMIDKKGEAVSSGELADVYERISGRLASKT